MTQTIKKSDIKIPSRYRSEKDIDSDFLESLRKFGVIYPVILTRGNELVDGERRILGCEKVGIEDIPFAYRDEVDELTRRELEVETNIRRKSFTNSELSFALLDLHRLKQKIHGEKMKGRQELVDGKVPGWSMEDTARSVLMQKGDVSLATQVAAYIERTGDEEVKKVLEKSRRKAYDLMRAKQEKEVRRVLTEVSKQEAPADQSEATKLVDSWFQNCDCIEGIRAIPDASIDLVYTDPPYGINIDLVKKDDKSDIYKDDSSDVLLALWKILPAELFRVLKPNSFCVIWSGWEHYDSIEREMKNVNFLTQPVPFVWVKTQSALQCNMPHLWDASGTDAAIICAKGSPVRVRQGLPSFICCPTLPPDQKKHPLERPPSLLIEHLTRFASAGQTILDPFAGSFSTGKAAFRLGMRPIGFEIDIDYYNQSREEMINLVCKTNQKKSP